MKKRVLAMLAYVLPSFPLGYLWHLTIFADYYANLQVFRDDLIIPLGLVSMLVQGTVWAFLYEKLFAGERVARGALKFALVAFPIAWSFMVAAVAAKHRMASASDFILIETAFLLLQYAVTSPLIAAVYARKTA